MPTFPGLHPNFQLENYPPAIRNAIRRIADTFYVTRSFGCIEVDNSSYYGALIRPTDDSSVALNTQRELLVVFADYDTFEIRTLEAFPNFYDLVESARVDKTIRFLVSADENVERAIKLYLEQHPEYPVVVPITFDQLERRLDPLISAVRLNHHIRDLFGFQSPLREEHFFFGRNDIVSSVIDLAKSGQHSSLFGLRKSGKTSTIYAIERRCKPNELKVVTFDCQDLQIHGRTYGELLIHVINTVRERSKLKKVVPPSKSDGPEVAEWFAKSMEMSLNSLQSNLLVIFDEIENISPGTAASDHWRTGKDPIYFWQVIRSFAQSSRKRCLSVCIVGTSPYILEQPKISDIDNPAYLLAQKRFIPNLDFDETREMVARLGFFMGLDFDPAAVSRLHSSYGGHPFFTRQVCSKIHQLTNGQRPKAVPLRRVEEAQQEFGGQLESYLYEIVSNLRTYYPDEFSLLKSLVSEDRDEFDEYVKEAPDLIDHLLGYGLVVTRDGSAELAFDAVKKAVLHLEPDERLVQLEGKWAELCLRRNAIEQGVRNTLYFWSRNLVKHEFEKLLEKQLSKRRFEALNDLSPRILFSKDSSPLYLSDLIAIIGNEKVLPYLGEYRSEIRDKLNLANNFRADAHAKNISDEEFVIAQSAFEKLEEEFLLA